MTGRVPLFTLILEEHTGRPTLPDPATRRYDQSMRLLPKRHVRVVLLVTILVLAALPSYFRLYSLAGGSEAPTLLLGDRFIVNRAAYDLRFPYSRIALSRIGSPRRGDEVSSLDLTTAVPTLTMPVFFFLGRHDHVIAAETSAAFLETLKAPSKRLLWFEGSAHEPPFEESSKLNAAMEEMVRPLLA